MTLQGLNDVKHWRDREAEMRVLSVEMKDHEARTLMLKLANDYRQTPIFASVGFPSYKNTMSLRGPVTSKAQECRAKAAQCEMSAAKTKDRELKEYYTHMARDWWDLARQIETLEAEVVTLATLAKRQW